MKTLLTLLVTLTWASLWLTTDQEGMYYFEQDKYIEAAETFLDPNWQGVAWYRAGEFKKAVQSFSRVNTAEGRFNQGNALLMHGKYEDAIASYDQALEKRPDWREAQENRELAVARAKLLDRKGGNMTEGMLGADEIVFDNKAGESGESVETDGGDALSDQEIQALWLRRVQTRPADFLKAKFAYQVSFQTGEEKK
jgi:Ca-activated chloride channel family protein